MALGDTMPQKANRAAVEKFVAECVVLVIFALSKSRSGVSDVVNVLKGPGYVCAVL